MLAAKHQSFTKAGEELKIAQSAVSRQIRLLEESLSTQLLIRSPQKVTLTNQGKELYTRASQFDLWSKEYFLETKEPIRISTLPGVLENWLLEHIINIDDTIAPSLEINVGTPSSIRKQLENNQIDIGLINEKIENENLTSLRVFKENFELISKKRIDMKQAHKYPWIYSEKGRHLNRISKKQSDSFIRVNSTSALLKLVEAGKGIAVVPSHMLNEKTRLYRTPIKNLSGAIYLCTPNYYIRPKNIDLFVKTITTNSV